MRSFLLFIFLSTTFCLSAQKIYNGKVVDTNNSPLEDVNVIIEGTSTGTITNNSGNFSVSSNNQNAILVFSALGFKTQKQQGGSNLTIVLQESSEILSEVVLVGTRNPRQTKLETPVAVDIVDVSKIKLTSAQTTANDLLANLVPSFNSNRQSSSDGTEHVDPASLRGLGPDQVLVLINGKRRHTTSLLNNQNTVGNGSVGTDLSSIPSAAIDRIEVLRDGAAAQYGSDAIAGVINIILKKNTGLEIGTTYGLTSEGDGETFNLNVNYGTEIGNKGGFINLTAEFNDRGKTSRSQNHNLVIYDQSDLGNFFAYDFSNDGARERDDELINAAGLTRDDFNFQVGDAAITNTQLFVNLELPTSKNGTFYAAGGGNYRTGNGFGFRRLPSEGHVLEIFPNGFQPILESTIIDLSLIAGYKTKLGEWDFDLSNTNGYNQFDYGISNTVNDALGINSPTSFDAGGHTFLQNTVNLDFSKFDDTIMSGLGLAFGAEYRYENYTIYAGEEGSYIGNGANSFPGFAPNNEVDEQRSSVGIYADVELNFTDKFLVDVAGRFENYSDFGNTINGKIAARYKLTDAVVLRGAFGTGFRAPSLQQQYFNNIATDLVDGNLINGGTFRNDSEIAQTLGIPELKEETSTSISVGLTAKVTNNFQITLDAYKVDIDDRIIYTGSLGNDVYGDEIPELQAILQPLGVSSARFFTNAINTSTAGVDLVMNYKVPLNEGALNFSLLYNHNETEVDDTLNNVPDIFVGQEDVYFGAQEKILIESNNPQDKAIFTVDLTKNKFGVMLRNTYWGEITRNGFPFGGAQLHSGKLTTDLTGSYNINDNLSLTVGANNLFDVLPDEQIYDNSYFGVFKYASVQMGTTGAFYFARLNYKI
ncbi:ferric enterobactin receptor [Polaribacter sejongensis]|uniref:Ferric enterobactin receptor n=1 Tax=Polaribacter sejongensis TaxID=985043 RepID=A0ABN5F9T7_9FLAO|nr:TonB-dependent receptor [Polaribacter sejongensis]AUC23319.1 ferric enterobactin receptor [Polaribacter sejongensis]